MYLLIFEFSSQDVGGGVLMLMYELLEIFHDLHTAIKIYYYSCLI